MALYDWRHEMENMLAAFNQQATHSLALIRLAFKRSGLAFTPEFKQYFMKTSTISINEAYDRFQVNSMFEEQLSPTLSSVAIMSPRNGTNGIESETDDRDNYTSIGDENEWVINASDSVIQIDDSGYDEIVVEAVETDPIGDEIAVDNGASSNASRNEIDSDTIVTQKTFDTYTSDDGSIATDDMSEISEYDHQENTKECYSIAPEVSSDLNCDVEMDDSSDSIEMAGNVNGLADAVADELSPTNVRLNRLDEAASAGLNEGTHVDWMSVATKGENSPRNQKRCFVCGYTTSHMGHFNRHMRTHTGERQYRCNRCGREFTSATSLMNHTATHIKEFAFYCRSCFRGFSLKAEAKDHEKQCRQRHYECHLCNFVTFTKYKLIRHMPKHTGDKQFHCEVCELRFSYKYWLKKHVNNTHSRIDK